MVNQIERTNMPRKAKPLAIKIEGLSGDEAHAAQPTPEPIYDDFTGLPIPMAVPEPIVPITPDHRELKRKAEARERVEQLSMLVRLGLVDMPDPIPPEPPKPKPIHLAHNQRLIGGKVWTFTNPNAMKRRT